MMTDEKELAPPCVDFGRVMSDSQCGNNGEGLQLGADPKVIKKAIWAIRFAVLVDGITGFVSHSFTMIHRLFLLQFSQEQSTVFCFSDFGPKLFNYGPR
jgi:hypothetical protein